MKSSWKIILVVLIIGSISALVYFYIIGNKSNSTDKNITIVRRIIDNKDSQSSDDTKIDQAVAGLITDISILQLNKDAAYLNEVIQDLKNF